MSTDNELDVMTDEQVAEYYYRHRDEIEHDPDEPVDIEPARPLRPGGYVKTTAVGGLPPADLPQALVCDVAKVGEPVTVVVVTSEQAAHDMLR